jgi:hypothetical protein
VTYGWVVAGLGAVNATLAVVLAAASAIHAGDFIRALRSGPDAGPALAFCLPAFLGWFAGGAVLSLWTLRGKLMVGVGLMAHTFVSALFMLALVLQPEDAAMPSWARVVGVLAADCALAAAYVVGVESGRRLARRPKQAPSGSPQRSPSSPK